MATMADTESFKQDVIRLNVRVTNLESDVKELKDIRKLLHKLDMDVARVETKVKTTWYFLTLIISGLIGIAFSLWQGLGG